MSLSARRAWIEISIDDLEPSKTRVALRKESVDRNFYYADRDADWVRVALRKESVDRNPELYKALSHVRWSLSARRAWIEISVTRYRPTPKPVALRKESVDRNTTRMCIIKKQH